MCQHAVLVEAVLIGGVAACTCAWQGWPARMHPLQAGSWVAWPMGPGLDAPRGHQQRTGAHAGTACAQTQQRRWPCIMPLPHSCRVPYIPSLQRTGAVHAWIAAPLHPSIHDHPSTQPSTLRHLPFSAQACPVAHTVSDSASLSALSFDTRQASKPAVRFSWFDAGGSMQAAHAHVRTCMRPF